MPPINPSTQPRLNWLELLGGVFDDTGFVLTSGGDGSIYLGGETNGGIWDGQTARGRRDGFVSRYNLAGQRLWTQWYGSNQDDQVRGLGVDPYGTLYVSGGTLGGMEGNTSFSPGASDGFLSRINAAGDKKWTLQLGGESWDLLRSLAVSQSDGAIYGIGYTASLSFSLLPSRPSPEVPPDAFVVKADAGKNIIWATRIGSGNQDYGMNLAVGNDGFIYVTGFSGDSDATSPARGFLRKLKASDGTVIYTRIIGDTISGHSYGEDLSIGIDGSIYVAISTDANLGGNINQGNRDVAVQKYDLNGNLIWTVLQGTPAKEEARTITTGPDGSVYLTGLTSGNLGGEINNGGEDAFITKISESGIIEWTKLLGTAANDVGWAVTTVGSNSLIVAGLTNGNLEGRTSNGGQDIFIASLDISEPAAAASVAVSLNRTNVREQDLEPLLFRFSRTGSLGEPLSISYSLGGTASQADYSGAVSGAAQIFILPAGVRSADLILSPAVDGLVEGDESIVLSLNPDPAYSIATPAPLQATLIGSLNHDPIATFGAQLSARVGAAPLNGKLSSTDQEDGDQAYFRLLRSAPAGFVLQDNGNWSFNPQDPQVLSIPAGERRSSSVVYRVEDRVPTSQPSLPQGVVLVGGANAQFATIQAALDGSPAGSVLLLAAGVYNERVTINKDVTILGAYYGIPADESSRGSASSESIISGYLSVAANVNQFNLDGVTLLGDSAFGVNMRVQAASSRLTNSIITGVRPPGGYADFAYVKYTRDPGLPAYTNITVENNVFNGNLDFNATPVVVQLNRSELIQASANTFLNTGGGGNIVLAGDSGAIRIQDNLIIGGGKGIATYDGSIEKLEIINNTILDANLNGIDLNFNSILKSGLIEGNLVQGSGIDRTNRGVTSANLSVSPQAELWSDFRIGNNNLSNPFGSNPAYQGFIPAGLTNATLQQSSVGSLTVDVEAQAPSTAADALPLAQSSDATRFRVSRFATDLGYPSSFAELSDGTLLAAVTLGDPANRSPFGSTPSQLVRLLDSNRDGVSDSQQVLATVPGFVTSLRRCGNLIFALSSGRQTVSPTLTILRTGATAAAPLVEEAVLRFQFPQAYLTATNPHSSYALAVRSSATVANGVELFFNLGPLEENRSTDPALTIGLNGSGDVEFAPAQMAPDSIQRLLITDQGDKLSIGAPLMVASGVRNAAGISFDRNGNLIFQDNGFSDPPNTEFTLSSDELNRINADELGRTVPDFGFSESYVRISDGLIVNPSAGYRAPLVSFLPLNGRKSEGAEEVSIAPSGFPSEFIDTVFTTFFGKFGVGTAKNDENPVLAANPETGAYYHFINSAQMGNPSGLLASGGSLYLGDYSRTGFFFGPGADTAGVIYRITPEQPPSFRNLPLLQQAGPSSANLAWSIDADAISSLELWGGSILAQAPRLYTLTPEASGSEFVFSAVLQDLQPGTTYFYRVRLGDQACEASFNTSGGVTPTVSLAIAEPSVTEDSQAPLRYLFSRSGDTMSTLTVDYTVGGTATLDIDYTGIAVTPATKTVTFAANSATVTVTVDPTVDSKIEPDETVALTLAAGTGYTIGTAAPVVGTILNDDTAIEIQGNTKLLRRGDGKAFVEDGAGTRRQINSPSGVTVGTDTSEWQMLAADTIAGVNKILWRNNTFNYLHIWNLDVNWNWQSSSGADGFYTTNAWDLENTFQVDPTKDGIIGTPFSSSNAIQLARGIDDSRFSVSRYATGLTFPTSMTELADRSILVAENKNGNSNLIRLADGNSDGISDSQTTLASLPGLISSVRRIGNLVFTISPFQSNNRAIISIWRTGQVSGNQSTDNLQLAGQVNLDYPVRFLHFTFALALRPNPQQPGVIDVFFNIGSQNDATATDPNLRVAINADSGATIPAAEMEPDSIQQISVRDLGNRLEVTAPIIIAKGLRNAAGITFDAKGNLIFEDNGIDTDPSGQIPSTSKSFSADELNMIAVNQIGAVVSHFGFPTNYTRSDSGVVANPSSNFRSPLATFLPLNGGKSEGAVEVAMAPAGFPGEFINTSFTNFFGIGNNAFNDENALVATDTSTGSYFHFINSNALGMGTGALSTQNSLYLSDRSLRLGTGSVYKISPKNPSTLISTPQLTSVNGTSQLNWLTSSDAVTSLEVWGGSIPSSNPRLSTYRPSPTGTANQFAASAPLDQFQQGATYSFKVQVGEQSNSGTFTLPGYNWANATALANIPSILRASVDMPSPRTGEAPLALTALRIDLQDPAISLISTGRTSGWTNNIIETSSQTTRQFISSARSNGQPVVAAINAAPFDLNTANQFQSVPTNIRGFSVSEGQLVSSTDYNGDTFRSTFLYDPIIGARIENMPSTLPSEITGSLANQPYAAPASEGSLAATLKVATSGFGIVLNNGQVTGDTILQNARSGLGLSADRRYLTLVAVDRRPNASQPSGWQGATDFDMGQILFGFGAANGMLLDGGGSTQLAWWNGGLAQAELLSNPLFERHVGSSLGVTYKPVV